MNRILFVLFLVCLLLCGHVFGASPTFQSFSQNDFKTNSNLINGRGRAQLWVSPAGNDTNSGASNAALATIHAALSKSTNINSGVDPIIIIRSGDYTNDWISFAGIIGRPEIMTFPGERARVFNGWLVSSFTPFRTNSGDIVYTATVNSDVTNTTSTLSSSGHPFIFEQGTPDLIITTNVPFNFTDVNAYMETPTNLLDHYRLMFTNGMVTTSLRRGQWVATNTTLYVSFSDGGVQNGRNVWIANSTNEFVRGNHGAVSPVISGIQVLFGKNGFNMSAFGDNWELAYCSGVGNFQSGWVALDQAPFAGIPIGNGYVHGFSGLGNVNQGMSVSSASGTVPSIIEEDHNVYAGNGRQGDDYHNQRSIGRLRNCFSGYQWYPQSSVTGLGFGAISGADVSLDNCVTVSNLTGAIASGPNTGHITMLSVKDCNFLQDFRSIVAGDAFSGDAWVTVSGSILDGYVQSISADGISNCYVVNLGGNYRSGRIPTASPNIGAGSGAAVFTSESEPLNPINISASTNIPSVLLSGNLLGTMVGGVSTTNVMIASTASSVPTSASEFHSGNTIVGGRGVGWGGQFAWQNMLVSCSGLRYATNNWAFGNIGFGASGTIGDGFNAAYNLFWASFGTATITNSRTILLSDGNTARRTVLDSRADLYYQNGFYLGDGGLNIESRATPVTVTGNQGALWVSNKVLYLRTTTKTNLISDGN